MGSSLFQRDWLIVQAAVVPEEQTRLLQLEVQV
jgi:hypothetical protein